MTSGGDAGDGGGVDDDGDDDGGEARGDGDDDGGEASGGSMAMAGGEASGGSVATTDGGDDGEGGPAKRQRSRRGGRKTGNQKDVTRRASASRDPV